MKVLLCAFGAGVVLVLLFFSGCRQRYQVLEPDRRLRYETKIGERDTAYLQNGSSLIMDMSSALTIMDEKRMKVWLDRGRFYFRTGLVNNDTVDIQANGFRMLVKADADFAVSFDPLQPDSIRLTMYGGTAYVESGNKMWSMVSDSSSYQVYKRSLSKLNFNDWKKDSSWLHDRYEFKKVKLVFLSVFMSQIRDTLIFIRCPGIDPMTLDDVVIDSNTSVYDIVYAIEKKYPTVRAEDYRKFYYTLGYRDTLYCGK